MNQANENMQYEDAMAEAARLRALAETIEAKEKVRKRLLELTEISKDPYYDQYLRQMMKDLESGKATPGQVAREADRTYKLYQQRMGQVSGTAIEQQVPQEAKTLSQSRQADPVQVTEDKPKKDTMEFKVGAGIFSTLGSVFVLAALVIIGFNLLEGVWQGVCLYVAAVAVILLSEIAVKRLNKTFSLVITGIGIASLFAATVINYLVLETIDGLVAAVLTFAIAIFAILLGRKKDATSIRLISVLGSYICFLPVEGFDSEISFLFLMGMVFVMNIASVLMPNQKRSEVIGCVHMIAHVVFTVLVTYTVLADGMEVMYVAFFAAMSLLLTNLIFYMERETVKDWFVVIYCIMLGITLITLLVIGCGNHGIDDEILLIVNRILTEVLAIVVAALFFVLLSDNKYRWIQFYFLTAFVVFCNGFSEYEIEAMIGITFMYILSKLICIKVKEVRGLDSVLTMITVLYWASYADDWYGIIFAVIAALSVFVIKEWHIYYEIVLTVYFWVFVLNCFDGSNWSMPVQVATLLILFLIFNHLPQLKEKKQLPYNVVNLTFVGLLSLGTAWCDEYWINSVTMLVGAVYIIIVFCKRYELGVARKYLILMGYLIYMIFAAHFTTAVIVSALLMVVAIACVVIGFFKKDKIYRICGLILAAFVCVKLIIFDFSELETVAKAILFLIVGIIALAISFIYIYLEKKDDEKEERIDER